MQTNKQRWPICNATKELSAVTFTVDLGTNLVVVRDTPAMVCSSCGDETAEILEQVVDDAKAKNRMIEVVDFVLEKVA